MTLAQSKLLPQSPMQVGIPNQCWLLQQPFSLKLRLIVTSMPMATSSTCYSAPVRNLFLIVSVLSLML